MSANFNTVLAQSMHFDWIATQDINAAIDVLSSLAKMRDVELVGTTKDLAVWFRTHVMCETELCKACTFFNGSFRTDYRIQMGRASAAHIGQRTSLFITFLIKEEVRRKRKFVTSTDLHDPLALWILRRQEAFPDDPDHSCPFYLSVFQDDLTFIAAGHDVAEEVWQAALTVFKRVGITLSDKPEANKPFDSTFESIGALYDTEDLDNILVMPTHKTLEKTGDAVKILTPSDLPKPREDVESAIGSISFAAKFALNGRAFLNSIYAMLHTQTNHHTDCIAISQDAARDANAIYRRLLQSRFHPLVTPKFCTFFGNQGCLRGRRLVFSIRK